MTRDDTDTNGGLQEELRSKLEQFGTRLQEEAQGLGPRIKEGIQEAVEEGKHPERRFGRPPKRRPPSGRPPSIS